MNLPPVTIASQSANEITLDLVMLPSLDAFRDHFPAHPILPGVVQVDWAVNLANQHLNTAIKSARDFQVKFRGIIRAGMIISLALQRDETRNKLSFTYRHGEDIMSSGVIRLDNPT